MADPSDPIPFPVRPRRGSANAAQAQAEVVPALPKPKPRGLPTAPGQPTDVQRAWLARGVSQAGGKLPLFDDAGKKIDQRTIRSCIEQGWAEPWFANPLKPDWLVCRLTDPGRAILTPNQD
jgi:hypothetical protein